LFSLNLNTGAVLAKGDDFSKTIGLPLPVEKLIVKRGMLYLKSDEVLNKIFAPLFP
jgi:hypothetical protein